MTDLPGKKMIMEVRLTARRAGDVKLQITLRFTSQCHHTDGTMARYGVMQHFHLSGPSDASLASLPRPVS